MDDMKGMFAALKRRTMEPRVYSLIVKGNRIVILHMGVYYSLDEAFAAVKERAMNETNTKDPSKLNLEMWMWEAMPASVVLTRFFGKEFQNQFLITPEANTENLTPAEISATEYARQVYDMKNELMKRIIDKKDLAALKEAQSILSKTELKLIRAKITTNEKGDEQAV